MLKRLAAESGTLTPTADDLIRLDRKRPGKKLSNEDWESPTDSDARIARMKDGRTSFPNRGLAYEPEHAVDLDTGAVLAAPIHHADRGDTKTLPETLEETAQKLDAIKLRPTVEAPAELVADKGYHSRDGLNKLHDGPLKTRITEPAPPTGKGGILRWHGDDQARNAVYANRRRLLSGVAKAAFKLRAEIVERAFALTLDRGGMRRTWLRGRDNVQKRYLIHIAGYNLGLIMRLLTGSGTPRRWAGSNSVAFWLRLPADGAHCAICLAILTNENLLQLASACIVIRIAER
jgi:transposase